jgi:pyridoxal phosphate enzyme (YggS family)
LRLRETDSIAARIEQAEEKIEAACRRSGRKRGDVKLMGVTKFYPLEVVQAAWDAGVRLFGENRVQEAAEKFPPLLERYQGIELHLIGSLQRNKVRQIMPLVSCIQSVDRSELITEIEKHAALCNKQVRILFEYHTGEESKAGFQSPDELYRAMDAAAACPHIIPAGFMTMAPFTADKEQVRASFRKLTAVAGEAQKRFPEMRLKELSMGMSSDYETAIEEGSTMVRIGTAIFGERT